MTNSNASVIDFLCKQGGNIDEQNKFGTTPIMWAAMYNSNPEVITTLVKNGADINDKRHKDGYSPLIWAIRCNRNLSVIERLCKLGADLSVTDKYDFNAIDWALINSPSFKWTEHLLKIINLIEEVFDTDDYTFALKSIKSICAGLQGEGHNDKLKILLKYCSNNQLKADALYVAMFSSDQNFIDLLNSIKFDSSEPTVKIFDFDTVIAKIYFIAFDDTEKLKALNNKFNINDKGYQFALSLICKSSNTASYLCNEVTEMDIEYQKWILTECTSETLLNTFLKAPFIDIYKKDSYGKTLLYTACENNNYEAAKILISKGADINTTCSTEKSRTPLLAQCYKSYPSEKVVSLLLQNGARINCKDEDGVSPIIAACYSNKNDAVIKQLLSYGASKTEKYKGDYPYEYCNSTIRNNYYATYKTLYNAAEYDSYGAYW